MNDFERRFCAQTKIFYIIKTFYMSKLNPKKCLHNATFSVQLPYIALYVYVSKL